MPLVTRDDGLTDDEGEVVDCLVGAWVQYRELPVEHEDEVAEFRYHIHMLQGLLTMRIARRHYPVGWPTESEESTPHARG